MPSVISHDAGVLGQFCSRTPFVHDSSTLQHCLLPFHLPAGTGKQKKLRWEDNPWDPWLSTTDVHIRKVVMQKGQPEPGKSKTKITPAPSLRMR